MPAAFILAFAQLWGDPKVRAVLWKGLLVTLILFAGLAWGVFTSVAMIEPEGWPAWAVRLWTAGGDDAAAVLLSALLTWLGFTSIATAVMAIWQDEIIVAVERRYYPAEQGHALGLGVELAMGGRAAMRVALINTALLPAYLVLLVTAVGPLVLFIIANGWALGREYLEAVAARHVAIGESRAWPGNHKWDSWGIGVLTAGLFAMPFLNLIAPMMGAMMATHIFHREREEQRRGAA
ncbi:EI24 domain-containing protein [Sandarakinorhabdus rubra]|uniref:EI24 domain-containing protein n=1 Tax=Sandarakinorhabdus rubra TaxID=2672568 RepID=UPI0013DBB799|nr:EI24 domain-containing protein [Sandarakinorhabdus rubra]